MGVIIKKNKALKIILVITQPKTTAKAIHIIYNGFNTIGNNKPKVKNTNELFTIVGWQKFSEGFFGGGLIGCVVAAILISIYAIYF